MYLIYNMLKGFEKESDWSKLESPIHAYGIQAQPMLHKLLNIIIINKCNLYVPVPYNQDIQGWD